MVRVDPCPAAVRSPLCAAILSLTPPLARSLQPGAADDSASHIAASHGEGVDCPVTDADVDDEPCFRRRKVSRAALHKVRGRESERVKATKPPLASPPALPAACALPLSNVDASSGCGDDSGGYYSDAALAATVPATGTRRRRRGQHEDIAPSLNSAVAVRVGLEQAALMPSPHTIGRRPATWAVSPLPSQGLHSIPCQCVLAPPCGPAPHPKSRRPTPWAVTRAIALSSAIIASIRVRRASGSNDPESRHGHGHNLNLRLNLDHRDSESG